MKKCLITIALIGFLLPFELISQDLSQIKGRKPFKVGGAFTAAGFLNHSNVEYGNQSPYGYRFGANLYFNVWGINVPFYASFNNQKSAFSHPFNRYGLSPRYKWAQAHIGYRTMNFSQFTMNNSTFLGAGIELKPKRFRFAAMYGTLQQGDALARISTGIPSYKRKALGIKIGFGTEARNLDFIILKAKDDILGHSYPDSIGQRMEAQENLVLGLKHRYSMFKNKLTLQVDLAGSIFSHDIRMDTIEVPQLTDRSWTQHVYTPSISTSASYAGEAKLSYRHKNMGISADYRRIMPEFYSLGAAYILNDLEAITLNPYIQLWKNKIALTASIGIQRDNLDGRRLATNQRNINAVNLQFTPNTKWGLNMSYSNFTFEQQVIVDSLYNDSMLINQLNHQLMIAPRYMLQSNRYRHTFLLSFNHQIMDNQNDLNPVQQSNQLSNASLVYDFMMKKTGVRFNSGINYFRFDGPLSVLSRYGISLGTNFKFYQKKIHTNFNISLNRQASNGANQDFLLSNLSVQYQLLKKTRLGLRTSYNLAIQSADTHEEMMMQLSLSQSF
jgi:hypothetical protein